MTTKRLISSCRNHVESSKLDGMLGPQIRLSTTTHASNSDHKPIWSCTIKIRIEYNEQDVRLSKGDEFVFGKTDNPDEVEALIRGAQMAVLHPNTKASYFLPEHKGAPVKEEQLLFSRNLVIVEIKGTRRWDGNKGWTDRFTVIRENHGHVRMFMAQKDHDWVSTPHPISPRGYAPKLY